MKSAIFIAGLLDSPSPSLPELGTKVYFSFWVDLMA